MKIDSSVHIYTRILLVSVLIAILGVSPAIHAFNSQMEKANLSARAGDWSSAAESLENALQYYPWRVDLALQAARYASIAGDANSVIQTFESSQVRSQLTTNDLLLLGDAYNQIGEPSKAELAWQEAAARGESLSALTKLADLYYQQKNYASTISYKEKLLSLNPADKSLYYQIGLLYAATQPLKALPFLAQSAEIDPSTASMVQALHDKIRTASLFDHPAYVLVVSGRQLANMGHWDLAAQAFVQATQADPGYADAWAFLGEAGQQINEQAPAAAPEVGLDALTTALELDGNSVPANTFMGLYWERQQDYTQAQKYVEQAIALTPDDPVLYTELGNILSKMGDLPEAQTAYEKAIQLTPQDPLFHRLLALYALDNQIQIRELALPAARQALMLDAKDPISLDLLARVMIELQDYHSAERYSLEALNSNPGYTPAYLHLAMAYLYLGQSQLAFKWLESAKNTEPNSWVSAQATRMLDYYFP